MFSIVAKTKYSSRHKGLTASSALQHYPATMKKHRRKIEIFLVCCIVIWVGISTFNHFYNKKIIKTILNIRDVPKSIRAINCKSPFISTDVITTCYAEVSPPEFADLLTGYIYKENKISSTSHQYPALGTKVGEEFVINLEYVVRPKKFIHGGHLIIPSNIKRDKIFIDIYEE